MLRKSENGIHWLEFALLQEERVKHAVVLRHGGVSSGSFSALNAGAAVGDDPSHVKENRKRIQETLFLDDLIIGRQVHGVNIESIKDNRLDEPCDGLFVQEKEKALTILHADCQAAIFYDPICHQVANIHCGWRGNVQNIYQKAVEFMRKMGSFPQNLLVCISPSLGPAWAQFVHYREEFPEHFHDFRGAEDKFDLWKISQMQLEQAGVLSHHIEVANMCTYENVDDFFSYRRENKTGRHATIVSLI